MLIAIRFQILHYHGKGSYFKKSELVSKVNLTTKCFSEGVNDKVMTFWDADLNIKGLGMED